MIQAARNQVAAYGGCNSVRLAHGPVKRHGAAQRQKARALRFARFILQVPQGGRQRGDSGIVEGRQLLGGMTDLQHNSTCLSGYRTASAGGTEDAAKGPCSAGGGDRTRLGVAAEEASASSWSSTRFHSSLLSHR